MTTQTADAALAAEILALERKRVKAMVEKDLPTLDALMADDMSYVHSGGRWDDTAAFHDVIASQASFYDGVDYAGEEVIVLGPDSVLIRGVAQIRIHRATGEKLSYPVWFVDVWVRRPAGWQMVAWQATRAPE
ncbi:MAG: nuclear transport factor 2 family protein [Dehalococcoidia bacterium]|nr:nuclear transport factor 2 family protein [Dehalococcoidia bacterium]